jgi:hypothetical protein
VIRPFLGDVASSFARARCRMACDLEAMIRLLSGSAIVKVKAMAGEDR